MHYFDLHVDTLLHGEIVDSGNLNLTAEQLAITPAKLENFRQFAVIFSIWSGNHFRGEEASVDALTRIKAAHDSLSKGGYMVAPRTRAEAEECLQQGVPLAFLGIEGGFALNSNPNNIAELKELGVVRYTLTHFDSPGWAASDSQDASHGLTEVGREIIWEMNRCGILPDVAHANERTMLDVVEHSKGPVLYSHGGPQELSSTARGISERAMKAIVRSGGLVGLSLFPHHHTNKVSYAPGALDEFFKGYSALKGSGVEPSEMRRTETLLLLTQFPHPLCLPSLDYFVHSYKLTLNTVGEDNICIGSDFDGSPFYFEGVGDCTDLERVVDLLKANRVSSSQVDKLFWQNAQRVVWEVLQ